MAVLRRVDTVGTDGTRVQNLTPTTGGSWFDLNEVWRVSSNRGARSGDSSATTRLNTSAAISTSDYDVNLLIRATSLSGDTTEIGIEARRSAASNEDYYQLTVDATTVSLSKRVGGDGGTALDSASWSPAIDTDYVLTLQVDGTSIKGFIDGVEVVSATDSSHAGPGHVAVIGSGAAGETGWQWEYVIVQDPEAGAGPTYTQSLAASVTASAVASRKTARSVTASVTPAGVVVRKTRRSLAASVTGAGVAVRKTKRTVSASVTSTTVVVRKAKRTVAASVTAASTVGRRIARGLAASVTATTTVGRRVARSLAASITPAGGLTASALFQQAVSASLTATAAVGRGMRITLAAGLLITAATVRQVRLALAASVTAAGALTPSLVAELLAGYVRATLTFVSQTVSSLTHRSQVDATLTETAETTGSLTHVTATDASLTHHTDD